MSCLQAWFHRFWFHLLALGVLLPLVKAQSPSPQKSKVDRRYVVARGSWSAATVSLFKTWTALDDNHGRRMSSYSPDDKKLIEVKDNDAYLRIGTKTFRTGINNDDNHDAELDWSPDSTKYFVTWTETGELGPWHMEVYGVNESAVHEFPRVQALALEDFEQRIRKMPIDPILRGVPNVKAIWAASEYCESYHVIGGRWLNGSQELLLSVLIPNIGTCKYGSEFNVYRVNAVTGRILQRFTAAEKHTSASGTSTYR